MAKYTLTVVAKRSANDPEETLVYELEAQPWPNAQGFLADHGVAPDTVVSLHEELEGDDDQARGDDGQWVADDQTKGPDGRWHHTS